VGWSSFRLTNHCRALCKVKLRQEVDRAACAPTSVGTGIAAAPPKPRNHPSCRLQTVFWKASLPFPERSLRAPDAREFRQVAGGRSARSDQIPALDNIMRDLMARKPNVGWAASIELANRSLARQAKCRCRHGAVGYRRRNAAAPGKANPGNTTLLPGVSGGFRLQQMAPPGHFTRPSPPG
jgi:hypothetical protein